MRTRPTYPKCSGLRTLLLEDTTETQPFRKNKSLPPNPWTAPSPTPMMRGEVSSSLGTARAYTGVYQCAQAVVSCCGDCGTEGLKSRQGEISPAILTSSNWAGTPGHTSTPQGWESRNLAKPGYFIRAVGWSILRGLSGTFFREVRVVNMMWKYNRKSYRSHQGQSCTKKCKPGL
jgi:hypothetical protein